MLDTWRAIDWGDAPTWLATAGAITAAFFAYKAVGIESGRDEQRREAERSAQASAVAAWGTDQLIASSTGWTGGIRIQNASAVPVYEARVTIYDAQEVKRGEFFPVAIPPGTQNLTFRILFDKYKVDVRVPNPDADGGRRLPDWATLRVALTFTDAAGSRWHRGTNGRLVPA